MSLPFDGNQHYPKPSVEQFTTCAPQPYCAGLGDIAPVFTAASFQDGEIKDVRLEDYRGRWVVLFFMAVISRLSDRQN